MGLELVDMIFRAEKSFGVELHSRDFARFLQASDVRDPTAGDFHQWVCESCRTEGKPVPHSSWNRVKIIIVASTGVNPSTIRKQSRLHADLGVG